MAGSIEEEKQIGLTTAGLSVSFVASLVTWLSIFTIGLMSYLNSLQTTTSSILFSQSTSLSWYTCHFPLIPLGTRTLELLITLHMIQESHDQGRLQQPRQGANSLLIKHVGHSFLHSSISSTSFHLNNLMHVLGLTKNLLSPSQFVWDNHVLFEFYPDICFVKSYVIKEISL